MFWRRKRPASDPDGALWKAVEDVQTCCGKQREQLAEVVRKTSAMEADVSLMWEKTNRALQRFAKRESRESNDGGASDDHPTPASRIEQLNRAIMDGEPIQ